MDSTYLPRRYASLATQTSFFKRALDIAVASAMLLVAAPIMLIIALLIKLDSSGPIFYAQIRVGRNRRKSGRRYDPSVQDTDLPSRRHGAHFGRPFQILKFRSMKVNAESKGAVWCKDGDPRVTRVGYWLRKTHLDELPQLFNILRGDMSMVGPRPERPEFVSQLKEMIPGYEVRLLVKPGLTGLAQTRHRSDLDVSDVKKKVRYDLLYVKNASVATDLGIMLQTAPLMFGLSPDRSRELTRASLFQPLRKAAIWMVMLFGWINRHV